MNRMLPTVALVVAIGFGALASLSSPAKADCISYWAADSYGPYGLEGHTEQICVNGFIEWLSRWF